MSKLLPLRAVRAATLAATAGLFLALASCGGGGAAAVVAAVGGGGVGTGGTGMTFGTVIGLGSVIVGGTPYSSATPTYYSASDSADALQTNSQAVDLGARVELQQIDSSNQPQSLVIQPEVDGVVGSVDTTTGTLQVNGERVLVNADSGKGPVTFYSGFTGLGGAAGVTVGTQVEVHGAYGEDASGPYIWATLIERLPASSTLSRLTGVVANLGATSFSVDGTSVPLAGTVIQPSGASLAGGDLVYAADQGGSWVVTVHGLGTTTGPVQVDGVAYAIGSQGFTLSGIPVDTTAMGASAPALVEGQYVVVSGHGDGHGTLVAQSIRTYSASNPATVELHGTITAFVNATSPFLVRGVPIDASAASYAAGSSSSQLGNGAYVDVVGTVSGNVVTASSIQVLSSAPTGETVDMQGTVASVIDPGHFLLNWQTEGGNRQVTVTIAPNCAYANGSAGSLSAGAPVAVEGLYQEDGANTVSAYTIRFLPTGGSSTSGGSSEPQDISGRVYAWSLGSAVTQATAVAAQDSSFSLEGTQLNILAANSVSIPAGFGDGVKVEVKFDPTTGNVLSIALDN